MTDQQKRGFFNRSKLTTNTESDINSMLNAYCARKLFVSSDFDHISKVFCKLPINAARATAYKWMYRSKMPNIASEDGRRVIPNWIMMVYPHYENKRMIEIADEFDAIQRVRIIKKWLDRNTRRTNTVIPLYRFYSRLILVCCSVGIHPDRARSIMSIFDSHYSNLIARAEKFINPSGNCEIITDTLIHAVGQILLHNNK